VKLDGVEGRVAFVTGAARGIGRCIAETMRDQGAHVAAGDMNPLDVEGVLSLEMDIAREEDVESAFARIETELGPVQLLVLNAGIFVIESFEETSLASWQRTLDVNLTGAFLCARRALPGMRANGFGRIVAIGSTAGKTGAAKSAAAYASSKAGIKTMTKSIASQYAGMGVTANAIAPALIDTEMIASIPEMREKVPLGRFGTPQEVADVAAFLCSSHASFITGEVVDVNGGFHID
jgi:3-oxoacyl-[acyl-carrier protein] reductase